MRIYVKNLFNVWIYSHVHVYVKADVFVHVSRRRRVFFETKRQLHAFAFVSRLKELLIGFH